MSSGPRRDSTRRTGQIGILDLKAASGSTRPASSTQNTVLWIALVATGYVAAARFGLALDAVSGFAAIVWPASGIALAALILGGNRLWPAVAIGAFATNYGVGAPLATAVGIAIGNTSAALAGAYMLRRVRGFDTSLERIRDVLALILLAAFASTIVSATVGSIVLLLSGIMKTADFMETWRAWWMGDAIGDLVVAPLIFVWAAWRPRDVSVARLVEAIGLGIIVVAVSILIFGAPDATSFVRGREYMLFPPLIWAALRFGVRGSITCAAIVMTIAVVRTSLGHGPFIVRGLHESLLELQTFMGIAGATFLLLGASISERKRSATELVLARETAEAANRAKAGFLAAMSHELRTPLNAITGYIDLLELELDGPLTEKQHATLSRISQSQRHLVRLIEDVLGFAQVEAGRLSFAMQPVIVGDALRSVEPIVGAEMKKKGLTLKVRECDPDLAVRADPDKLRQILLNLVTNAMKFTSSAGEIGIFAEREGQSVRISVSDTGIGIPKDQIDRVFDPFFQVEQGATRRYPGLGLGLSIVRDVVLAMQGGVDIKSVVGEGTTVSIVLPQAAIQAAAVDAARSYSTPPAPEPSIS
jgi:signal transduction histidine kinase